MDSLSQPQHSNSHISLSLFLLLFITAFYSTGEVTPPLLLIPFLLFKFFQIRFFSINDVASTYSFLSFLFYFGLFAESQSFIGVNYGQVANNLPAPEATAKLLQSTTIKNVRLYGADPAITKALAGTGVGIVIGASNGDIPALASDPNSAAQWVNSNVLPFYPASNITLVTVGNEVLTFGDQGLISQLVPAMRNVQNALTAASLGGKVRVSTVHSMAVLGQSDPPSSGQFRPELQGTLNALLAFQRNNHSPFAINPYPFFAYQSDQRPETLAFCLFQPNSGRVDSGTGIKYMNMFDAQVSFKGRSTIFLELTFFTILTILILKKMVKYLFILVVLNTYFKFFLQ